MNLDYLFFHLPDASSADLAVLPPGWTRHVACSSPVPACCFAVRADWRRPPPWLLLGAAVLVLIPTLLYYGGGWLQYGYRYALDSVPFVIALCASAAATRGPISLGWRLLILFGVVVMFAGVYWAYGI